MDSQKKAELKDKIDFILAELGSETETFEASEPISFEVWLMEDKDTQKKKTTVKANSPEEAIRKVYSKWEGLPEMEPQHKIFAKPEKNQYCAYGTIYSKSIRQILRGN